MAVNQQKLLGKTTTVQTAAVQPQTQLVAAPADTAVLQDISKSLTRIIQLLTLQNTQVVKESDQERRNQENARRKRIELGLENTFAAVKSTAQAVVAPVKNILDQIIQFFVTLFLGKALLNLIDWFANKDNRDKVRSIARFLRDWWPSLVAGYILFGTGFGRVVRSIAATSIRAVALLGSVAFKLAAAIANAFRLKKAGSALSALGGGGRGLKGILVKLAQLGAGAGIAYGGYKLYQGMVGGETGGAPQLQIPQLPGIPTAQAFGGGFIDFKTMLAATGGQVDSKLGIFTQFFKSGGFAALLNGFPGIVSGPKGIDKVPAMLTDGEFVMSRGAVNKFGVGLLEAMNAAGGGTNRPKVVYERIHAAGGGYIGEDPPSAEMSPDQPDPLSSIIEGSLSGPGATMMTVRPAAQAASRGLGRFATRTAMQVGGRTLAKPIRSIASRFGSNVALKSIAKIGTGALGKSLLKKIPLLGLGMGAVFAAQRAMKGDIIGAGLEMLSGAASTIPGLGTGVSIGIDAALAAKDAGVFGDKPGTSGGANGVMGGPSMKAKTDYASSKGKYYSSSDQKTYANYNDALAAKKSRMISLASQQRLNKLSYERTPGARYSAGRRFDAESLARTREDIQRGGMFGQLGRSFTGLFGSEKDKARIASEDKASQARIKQAGAASIGRYYSSSDGKYYKDYNAALQARKARLATTKPKPRVITPTPKPKPKVVSGSTRVAGGGMNGARGSGSRPSVPSISSTRPGSTNRKVANQLGVR